MTDKINDEISRRFKRSYSITRVRGTDYMIRRIKGTFQGQVQRYRVPVLWKVFTPNGKHIDSFLTKKRAIKCAVKHFNLLKAHRAIQEGLS